MAFSTSTAVSVSLKKFLAGCILVSLGITLSVSGGFWDVTYHLLNRPEAFFSAPHTVLYAGISLALVGVLIMFFGRNSIGYGISRPVKTALVGIGLLVSAGPIDFGWHSEFGLDGLLSPPHLALISGMMLCSIGSMLGILSYNHKSEEKRNSFSWKALVIIGILPVWMVFSGIIHMLSLPFSDTEYFNFNPDPTFAVILSTIGFPFLVSFFLSMTSSLAKSRFGVLSITGAVFIAITAITGIVPNHSLISTLPFYVLNIIPITTSDAILAIYQKRTSKFIVGAILGSSFFTLYYPLITHTFNEFFSRQPLFPSLVSPTYFGMIANVYPVVVLPAIVMGIGGTIAASKLVKA